MCSLYIYTSQYLKKKIYRKVYNIFFEDGLRKANDNLFTLQTVIQSFTSNINVTTATYNFALKKNWQTRDRKADESNVKIEKNSFIF